MASLLPAAICAQRPGDAIHGCMATLLRPAASAIWPELGNGSFQSIQSLRHGCQKTTRRKKRGRHPSTHDATHLRPRIDRPRGPGRSTAAQTSAAFEMFRMGKSARFGRMIDVKLLGATSARTEPLAQADDLDIDQQFG